SGGIIYSLTFDRHNPSSWADWAIGNFNSSTPEDEICFTLSNYPMTIMIENPNNYSKNATIGWSYNPSQIYDYLETGENLIKDSGSRDDLLFGYASGSNYVIEARRGDNGAILNWTRTLSEFQDPQISIGDLDNNGIDEIILGDDLGYLKVYEAPGSYQWDTFLGSKISVIKNYDLIGDSNKEIIVNPLGHLIILQNNGTKKLDIGSSEVYKILPSNLDSDPNKEIIAFFKENRITAIDNNGAKLWDYIAPIPVNYYNEMLLIDKDNDGIDDYLYYMSGNIGHTEDFILDISSSPPTVADSQLLAGFDAAIGDLDRDGIKDDIIIGGFSLAVNTITPSGIQALWEKSFVYGPISNLIWDIAVGDFIGNGYDDIACTFMAYNTSDPNNSPVNRTVIAFNGLTGAEIFRFSNLNNSNGIIEAADLDEDGIDEIIVGMAPRNYQKSPEGNLTVIKKSGSKGIVLWNTTLATTIYDIEIGDFTNDSNLDVAAISYSNELKVFNGTNGNFLSQYNGLPHIQLTKGKINNLNDDYELISASDMGSYSTVNVFTRNYSQTVYPETLDLTKYPSYENGDITYIIAANITGDSRDNIIIGTEKGIVSCISAFEVKKLANFKITVNIQNKTCIAGENLKIYFEIERNEPDILRKIEMTLYEWGSNRFIELYIMEDQIKDIRIEPGITRITANFPISISLKGKYYISGSVFLDNMTRYDIINDASEKKFFIEPFDILGKQEYTYIENVDVANRVLKYFDYTQFNISLRNTLNSIDTINLTISVCIGNMIINKTFENIIMGANSISKITRKIYVPYKIPTKLIAYYGLIHIAIEGSQGRDSYSKTMLLSDVNGADKGYYFSNCEIYNSSHNKIIGYSKNNVTNQKIIQINRSATNFIQNYSMDVSFYNEYNFDIIVFGMFLVSDLNEESSIFDNTTRDPGIQLSWKYGYNHTGNSIATFLFNFSFAQTTLEGVHSMFLIVLSVNFHSFKIEYSSLQITYNLTGKLNNSFYFTDDFSIPNSIVQYGQNITATATLNFTSIPEPNANLTAVIQITEALNNSHYYNITKLYYIGGLSSLTLNMSINTIKFNNSLILLYLGIVDRNFSKIIIPWETIGIYGAVISIVSTEDTGIYSANKSGSIIYDLKYGNLTIGANFSKNLKLSVNSFNAWRNPAPKFISEYVSEELDTIGFWKIETNDTISPKHYNEDVLITINYLPEFAFAQRIHESDLIPYYYNQSSEQWEQIVNFNINTNTNTISFTITHFSDFTIGGQKDDTKPLIRITTTFSKGKTQNKEITISWQSTFSEWASYWDHYSLYLNNIFLNDATNNSQKITLPSIEQSHTIKLVAYDIFGNKDSDEISVWLDLDTLKITKTSDNVKNNGDLPSTGYLKLTWQGSSGLQYYIIKVNDEVLESSFTGTSYEFKFTESGDYKIEIIGVDGFGDQTTVIFNVSYDAPDKVSKSSEEIDLTIVTMVLIGAIAISAIGVVLLVLRKDKTIDYSKMKSLKK
ncbi:MAG: hypothetical protein ACTSQJ_13020, partial [Promethearchaeota archaeon]